MGGTDPRGTTVLQPEAANVAHYVSGNGHGRAQKEGAMRTRYWQADTSQNPVRLSFRAS